MYLWLLLVAILVTFAWLKLFNPRHPWRTTTPLSNEERYMKWVERHAEFERRQRIKKTRQRMRVLRQLDQRYAQRATVHVPSRGACQQ